MNELLRLGFGRLGYDYDFLTRINRSVYHDKYLFRGEGDICLKLRALKACGKRVVVLPDFDMDGISAGCVLFAGLSLFGFPVSLYEPDPSGGYGFRKSDIDAILEQWPDAGMVLTCDVGVAEEFAVAYAKAMGLTVCVTDHHIEKPGKRVDADAVMDPCRYDETAPFKGVCGAWVAWHFVQTYASLSGSDTTRELCRKLVLFTGLGSCGDLMPMIHDTRAAVSASVLEFNRLLDADDVSAYFGCPADVLPEAYTAPFENIRALHYFLIDCGKVRPGDVTDETYSFTYCPMFNSVRRMGEKMSGVYSMLYKRHAWNSIERLTLFRWLCDLNDGRKALVGELYGKLYGADDQALAPYIYLVDAAPGVLGLLAAKLMERNGRPCLVLRPDPARKGFSGSGRTMDWMDAGSMFAVDGVTTDGHEHAFGAFVRQDVLMTLWGRMDAQYLSEHARHDACCRSMPDPRPRIYVGKPGMAVPCDFEVSSPDGYDVCMDYAYEIQKFRPFGNSFREPEFILMFHGSGVDSARTMGSDKQHLSLDLGHGVRAVWFGGAGFLERLSAGGPDTVYALSGVFGLNEFRGSTSLQFMVSAEVC